MAEDLEARVPVKGLMDCQIDKGEVPLRVRQKRENARGKQRKTLGEVWREAKLKKERGGEEEVGAEFSQGNDGAIALEDIFVQDRTSP